MRGPLVFCLDPAQREDLKNLDPVELSRIVLDPGALALAPDHTVRPGGVACRVKLHAPGQTVVECVYRRRRELAGGRRPN